MSAFAVALFALWGIGGPLIGRSVLAATNELAMRGPYVNAGLAGQQTRNTTLDDTYTSRLPDIILFKDSLARGEPAGWDPYGAGGSPLAAVPNSALLSPLTIPYFLLPTWLAPAYEKLLEIVCAVGGCVLFLRRLRVGLPAALVGGLVFAGSAFMVVWLDFPQTQVAAFIPALFWTVERFIQNGRLRDAALISLPVAAMLLGGFPSVAGYALLTAGAYVVVRVLAEHRREPRRARGGLRWATGRLRWATGRLLGAGAGVAAGIGLTMFQLLPFAAFYRTWLIEGREQTAADHLDPISLVTAVAPWALGTVDPSRLPYFFVAPNLPEAMSYLGAGALVLAAVAIASPHRGRVALPRAGWWFVVAATLVWAELIYLGGPPLALAQQAPGLRELFAGNYIGRARSVLGFLVAVLAAVGFELLLRRWRPADIDLPADTAEPAAAGWTARRWWWPAAVGILAAMVAGLVVWAARRRAAGVGVEYTLGRASAMRRYDTQLALAAVVVIVAVACVVLLWYGGPGARTRPWWRRARCAAAALLPLLIAGQGLYVVRDYYPSADRATFYPVTDTHRYLAENLGQERFAASTAAVVMGTASAYRLRSVNGHAFVNEAFARLVRGIAGDPIAYPTHVDFTADLAQATSPILDRLGTRFFVTSPTEQVFGVAGRTPSDGTALLLSPRRPVTAVVTGPLRAVGFTPSGAVPESVSRNATTDSVEVVVRDAGGTEVARARRLTRLMTAGADFLVPVALPDAAAGAPPDTPYTVTLTLYADEPVGVAAAGDDLAWSTVVGTDDGLRLVYAGSTVIYQRLDALPRIRWASRTVVDTDPDDRVARLANGTVDAGTVVLSAPGPAADNAPARVRVDDDGTDVVTVRVDAEGAGYLVVADADQTGWSATVDGAPADLVAADQGLVAVAVAAGGHTVTLRFAAPSSTAGGWISVITAFAVLSMIAGDWWRDRRRGATPPEQPLGYQPFIRSTGEV